MDLTNSSGVASGNTSTEDITDSPSKKLKATGNPKPDSPVSKSTDDLKRSVHSLKHRISEDFLYGNVSPTKPLQRFTMSIDLAMDSLKGTA